MWKKINRLFEIYLIFYWLIGTILVTFDNYQPDRFQLVFAFLSALFLAITWLVEDLIKGENDNG